MSNGYNLIKATPQSNQGYNAHSLKHKERTGKEPWGYGWLLL